MPVPFMFRIFWIAPMLLGALLGWNAINQWRDGDASVQWRPTQATVIRVSAGTGGFLRKQHAGTYRWMVDGREVLGSEVDCCGSHWDRYIKAKGAVKSGDTVTIYVDPANAERAVLMTGSNLRCLSPIGAGFALVLAGYWIRKRITGDSLGSARGF